MRIRAPATASIGSAASGRSSASTGAAVASACHAASALREARAAQAAPQARELARPPAREQRAQRLELGGALGRQRRHELIPLEQLHVEVAHGPGERLRPLQLVAQVRALRRVVDVP